MSDTIDGLPTPRRWWAMAAIWLAVVMAVLDSAIANVALPTIAHDLGASPAQSIWVVNAYQIAIVMLLLTVASLGEILGYRRVYAVGLILFVAASIACAFAGSLTGLALARFAQGFGAAAIMGINGALVRFTYPSAKLGRGIGYNALVVAISSAAGPSVAATILAVASWRWLFAINVPFGLASLAIGLAALPTPPREHRRFDWRSALLAATVFAALFTFAAGLAHGTFSPTSVAALIVGIGASVPLIRIARRERDPLIPLDLIGVPLLRLSYATSIASFAAQMAGLVALPFYLQTRWGYDHVAAGLAITALPLGVAVAAPVAGRLIERVAAGVLGGVGLVLLACCYAAIAVLPPRAGGAALIAAIALCGVGFGLFQAPNNRTMMGAAPRQTERCRGGYAGDVAADRSDPGRGGRRLPVPRRGNLVGTPLRHRGGAGAFRGGVQLPKARRGMTDGAGTAPGISSGHRTDVIRVGQIVCPLLAQGFKLHAEFREPETMMDFTNGPHEFGVTLSQRASGNNRHLQLSEPTVEHRMATEDQIRRFLRTTAWVPAPYGHVCIRR